ncbi:MAG: zinc ribbon domain-containing protein [Elusimicrobiota bacterium]
MATAIATVKCPGCGYENKENAKSCRKCGRDMAVPPAWQPDFAWHLKTLGVIYAGLTLFYLGVTAVLSKLPKPYHLRNIPIEMTPWLVPGGKVHLPEEQLKAPPMPATPPAAPATK